MKKIICFFIIGFVFLCIATPVFSQQTEAEKDYKFTIKTNPLSALGGPFWVTIIPVTGEYKVLFEAAVTKKSSIQVGAGILGPSILINLDELTKSGDTISGLKTSGFRIQGMYKYFISRDLSAPAGFYIGPHISYASAKIKSKDKPADNIAATKLNINAVIGYQMITSGGFTMDIYTGMGYLSREFTVSGTNTSFDMGSFKTKKRVSIPFGFSFGYAF